MALRLRYNDQSIVLPTGQLFIGRSPECHIVVDDMIASRRHAVITMGKSGAFVTDLASKAGVRVNGEIVSGARRLARGDMIHIAAFRILIEELTFDSLDDEATDPKLRAPTPPTGLPPGMRLRPTPPLGIPRVDPGSSFDTLDSDSEDYRLSRTLDALPRRPRPADAARSAPPSSSSPVSARPVEAGRTPPPPSSSPVSARPPEAGRAAPPSVGPRPPETGRTPPPASPRPPEAAHTAPPPSNAGTLRPPEAVQTAPPPSNAGRPRPSEAARTAPPPSDAGRPPEAVQTAPPPSNAGRPRPPEAGRTAPAPSNAGSPRSAELLRTAPPPSSTDATRSPSDAARPSSAGHAAVNIPRNTPLPTFARADSLRLIARVAEKALAFGRAEEAERILVRALGETMEAARRDEIDEATAEIAASLGARLAVATSASRWFDYAVELWALRDEVAPASVIDLLYAAIGKLKGVNKTLFREYLTVVKDLGKDSPARRFLIQRLEGLQRLMDLK
jgi:hypothetical protein